MLDDDTPSTSPAESDEPAAAPARRTRRRAASRPAGPPEAAAAAPAEPADAPAEPAAEPPVAEESAAEAPTAKKQAAKKPKKEAAKRASRASAAADDEARSPEEPAAPVAEAGEETGPDGPVAAVPLLFQAPQPVAKPARGRGKAVEVGEPAAETPEASPDEQVGEDAEAEATTPDEGAGSRRRRSRGGRNRRKSSDAADAESTGGDEAAEAPAADSAGEDEAADDAPSSSRRRRRRRRGDDAGDDSGDGEKPRGRSSRQSKESITSVEGSTRIEAKRQRRREGREAGRRRPPILSESEFLARREAVERVMVIRQRGETTQIAVLEDNILVEHYVALESQNSLIGNVYLGRVQNVLPSMEAAFIDIGRGRNAVLYAGEVNWDLIGDSGQPRRIENALKPGQSVLVQVSKDPVGHKGARLTSQISLPGRYLVFVPGGGTSGISRKLPDTERNRLKSLLKEILPEDAGVIIRTAAEGASEDELTRDVTRLTARWEDIEKKAKGGQAPAMLYAEPDTTLKVVRDLFTEDFTKLVISGEDAWDMVDAYVQHVAPDLAERLQRHEGDDDVFTSYRVDEQIAKALERKVWLPSGGSLVIDRTEAMTVIDVNTGKFTGSGGNLEETVTKNNLEAAEEIVRQLRLRDIGGIIVVDFIDMVLENNRDLVLRRLVECLGRDRTRHQVAEVTSLGLVQMTRKRISTGLLEAFSHTCEHCQGRGVLVDQAPVEPKKAERGHGSSESGSRSSKRSSRGRRGRRSGSSDSGSNGSSGSSDSGSNGSSGSSDSGSKGSSGSSDSGSNGAAAPAEAATS